MLSRVLDEPGLAEAVQALPPLVLAKLIHHVGLEDAGEIISLATIEQLTDLFDEDLWKIDQAGAAERFDPKRFVMWLEIMLESGEKFVANKLAELSPDLVALGVNRNALVIDLDELAQEMDDDEESDQIEKALDSCLCEEFDQYRVISREHNGWDVVVAALFALDAHHHEVLERVLERCCVASREYIDDNGGLYDVLSSDEMLESDASAEREDRRAAEGFVSAAAARSFLSLAQVTSLEDLTAAKEKDPVTRAYFRELSPKKAATHATSEETTRKTRSLLRILEEGGVIEKPSAQSLLPSAPQSGAFERAMQTLFESDPKIHAERMDELAYLANVLVATLGEEGRTMRAVDAAMRVARICNGGLAHLRALQKRANTDEDLVRKNSADKLFLIGFRLIQDAKAHA